MIEERALVVSIKPHEEHAVATVKVDRKSACDSCQLKSGCGQSTMTKLSAQKCIEFDVQNTLGVDVGDYVTVSLPERGLLSASIAVYLMPLIIMILSSLGARVLFNWGDVATSISGGLGLIAGFYLARSYGATQSENADFQPRLERVLPPE